jgi:hypothetical protein
MAVRYPIPTLPQTFNGRQTMRSIADACERLREDDHLPYGSLIQIRTFPLTLPTGYITSLVLAITQRHEDEPSRGVALPSSALFKAKRDDGSFEKYDISRLDEAWVDDRNRVELVDGTHLHSVDLTPTVICRELNETQKRILRLTIECMGAEEICYRGLPDRLLPGHRFLDFSTLPSLELPSLKVIEGRINKKDPSLAACRQTIANALSASGMRRPRSGPRSSR